MSTLRTLTRVLLTVAVVVSVAFTSLTARAYEPIEFSHKPGEATFTNPNDVAVQISYGRANSGDVHYVEVPAGGSVKVQSADQHFGYTASIDGEQISILEWPGADLSASSEASNFDPVTAKIGNGSVTFTNPNKEAADLWYGTPNSEDMLVITVPAGGSVTVKINMTNKHFGWGADINEVPVGGVGWPGIDLTKKNPSLPSTGN